MTRYVALPRQPLAWDSNSGPLLERPSTTVIEAENTPEPIGLVDQHGTPLYRVRETVTMGFCP